MFYHTYRYRATPESKNRAESEEVEVLAARNTFNSIPIFRYLESGAEAEVLAKHHF